MNIVVWIFQVVLSIFFILPGIVKIRNSKKQHIADGHIKSGQSILPIRILGVLELLGCIGIVLPWYSSVLPILTPITSVCFCLLMLADTVVHLMKKEYKMMPMLVVVFTLSFLVAYYRFGDFL
ncbi:DoxX family protein [Flavobacterium sp. J27]|uniref:DoxX family protein n=1 Tax=Flavobacterium sp. J27 TaxID=2060419 RepID=UPI00103191F8|nr:DoxX family protein [Flavobacterium sp. J27]